MAVSSGASDAEKAQQYERTQARIGLASNILGLTAGTAAIGTAMRDPRLRKKKAGPVARGLASVGNKMPTPISDKLDSWAKDPKKRAKATKIGGSLAAGAVGLQVLNTAGDVVSNRVLTREAHMGELKRKEFSSGASTGSRIDDKKDNLSKALATTVGRHAKPGLFGGSAGSHRAPASRKARRATAANARQAAPQYQSPQQTAPVTPPVAPDASSVQQGSRLGQGLLIGGLGGLAGAQFINKSYDAVRQRDRHEGAALGASALATPALTAAAGRQFIGTGRDTKWSVSRSLTDDEKEIARQTRNRTRNTIASHLKNDELVNEDGRKPRLGNPENIKGYEARTRGILLRPRPEGSLGSGSRAALYGSGALASGALATKILRDRKEQSSWS